MSRKQLEEKVLEYWFALEFLAQDKYPDCWDVKNKIDNHKKNVTSRTAKNKLIEDFVSLTGKEIKENLYEIIANEAIACGMKKWGNLTIYIGKVKRERCIDCISKVLPFDPEDENRPEKNGDKIAWMSLQLSPEGTYVKGSLSLSTIIWALNQIKLAKGDISDSLDEKLYNNAVQEIEKKFFGKNVEVTLADDKEKKTATDNFTKRETTEEEKLQDFSATAISIERLHALYKDVEERYVKGNIENTEDTYEEVYGISFQLFADENTKNKREDDNYLGLSHDYYSDDIKHILEKAKNGELAQTPYIGRDILSYITALEEEGILTDKRIDLVNPKVQGKDEFLRQINEILAAENAPLGKWPSRYMPVFMQQIAINLAIGKGTTKLYGVNGKVFSVNGPPGTGKTTLLKEIVVNNIIERAILLAEYDDPDKEAFIKHDFSQGDGPENAYSQYTRHWYSLKNDRINEYSMLVTSCNNAAVENISKEFPKIKLEDLQPLESDTDELKVLLAEVGKLFDAYESGVDETTYQKETYKDVYFTKYAKELLDEEEAWGLIAAPLGKKSNLSNFYNKVLYSLGRDFYGTKDTASNRVKAFQAAKKKFREQLKIVRDMQNDLGRAGYLFVQKVTVEKAAAKTCERCEAAITVSKHEIEKDQKNISELNNQKEEQQAKVLSCEAALHQMENNLRAKEEVLTDAKAKIKDCLEKELLARNSVGIIARIFNKFKYEAAMNLADENKKDADEQKSIAASLEAEINQIKESIVPAEVLSNRIKKEYGEMTARLDRLRKKVISEEKKIAACETEQQQARGELESAEKAYAAEKGRLSGINAANRRIVIDEKFVERLLSDDANTSTAAQVDNPWFTQRYNREREKLFGYAMRMNKEFVVSSNHCRDNFATLAQYWGLRPGDENERIIFHREDKEKMVSALFQTLFLLVPVISSTFASVGRLLKDIKQPGAIGMLVIDEAGQAQPQMALGALYRSRRAVIVGDPKQVEPVVTDDMILLKKAYNDDVLKPYKKKTLSVQGFADRLNMFGTYLGNESDYPDWVGCPLLVHRRCISPMYEISNELSYNGIMIQQTSLPKPEKVEKFIYDKSQWINVKGKEKGNKNHFVDAQGQKVCELLELAFSKNPEPSVYIISPFTTVISGIKEYIKKYCREHNNITKINRDYILDNDQKKIGTVHTFQGKEADEVIFLLGCDTSEDAKGAIRWVNKNIVNVAATRAQYRLYVIGDEEAWKASACIHKAKQIIDTFAIKEIKFIFEANITERERKEALEKASRALPSVTSFTTFEFQDENGVVDYSVDTSGLIQGLNEEFLNAELSTEQLGIFGFRDRKDLEKLTLKVKENILLGMKLFFLLEPVYKVNAQLDASCCSILFCKAMELQMKDCFTDSLKKIFPDIQVKGMGKGRGRIPLKDAQSKELTLGAFATILRNNSSALGNKMKMLGKDTYDAAWWSSFQEKLSDCIDKRNKCCHAGLFNWREQSFLLFDIFSKDTKEQNRSREIDGILFESQIGNELKRLPVMVKTSVVNQL